MPKQSRELKFKLTKNHVKESEAEQKLTAAYCAICPVAICISKKLDLPLLYDKIPNMGVDTNSIRLINIDLETPRDVAYFISYYDTYKNTNHKKNYLDLLPITFTLEIPNSIKTRKRNEKTSVESTV